MVTSAVSLTVYEIQAVLMLKTTFLHNPLIFYLEFESHCHAVGMWRRNLSPEHYGSAYARHDQGRTDYDD